MNHPKRHFKFQTIAFMLLSLLMVQSATAQESKMPFDVFGEAIDKNVIYRHLEKQANELVARQPEDTVASFRASLASANGACKLGIESLTNSGAVEKDDLYRHMVKSTVFVGELFNCGHCDRTHVSSSGGVAISEDGLVLTNYHVLQGRNKTLTEGVLAMTHDGRCFEIQEVLAANEAADIALIRLKSEGYKFHPAPIAKVRPQPVESVRIVSNPSSEFFVMTEGEVSRYSVHREKVWMEITADFGQGSSGSGIFNDSGEVVGLVSSINPLIRSETQVGLNKDGDKVTRAQTYTEMILRRCVPLKEIHNCFRQEDADSSSDKR